jgi:uncharacterized protein (DUF58 family)
MAFATGAQETADLADQLAAAVGLLADGPADRLGLLVFGPAGLDWRRPVAGRVAARRALRGPAVRPREGPSPVTLADALEALARRHRRPGVRVVVSDFLDPDGDVERPFRWEAPLRRLAARHDVVALEVVDPREQHLPDVGHVVLLDPESGRRREVDTGDPRLRQRYAAAAADHRAAVAAALRAAGAAHVRLSTDRDWVADLARAVRSRRVRARRRRVR